MILNTRPYTDFLTFVLPLVPNCYEEQAIAAIRNTCIDFCRDSLFLQTDIDPMPVIAGISTYDIDVPTGYVLGQMLGIYYLNRKLERKSQAELEKLYTRNWQYLQGNPQVYTQLNPDQITLVYTPAETAQQAITGRFSYVPSRTSTVIDTMIYERFLDVIVDGAASRLMATPNQPYSDATASLAYQRVFRDGCQRALRYTRDGMNNAPMRARYNRIW